MPMYLDCKVSDLWRLLSQQNFQRNQYCITQSWANRHPIYQHFNIVYYNDTKRTFVGIPERLIKLLYLLHLAKANHVFWRNQFDEGETRLNRHFRCEGCFTTSGRAMQ